MSMEHTEQYIKSQLFELLQSDSNDYSQILTLSNELAQMDKKNIRFSVDAGIITRLGKELVGKGETAISELIKNAYDADATYVNLIFKNAFRPGGTLIIEDDGCGMNYEELVNGFMRISSSDKIHNPITFKYKRKKAGRKGIGRFATQRLGQTLTIITQKEESDLAIQTSINWNNFGIDQDLANITSEVQYIPKKRNKGTTLVIQDLQDAWSDAAIMRAYKYTDSLLLPEPLSKERIKWDANRQDPGFKAQLYRDSISEDNLIINEDVAFLNHALAIIEGYIDEQGHGFWKVSSDKIEIPYTNYTPIGSTRDEDNQPYSQVRNIHFKTRYFIYSSDLIPKTLFTYIKNLGNELGGIKLYRNGFRVPPYGEGQNDWLGFDESVRRRNFLFPHQNQSFFGFVEIDDAAADLFEETSSREGLIENVAYDELRDFVYRSVTAACQTIASIRNKKQTANQKNWEKSSSEKIEEAIDELHQMSQEDGSSNSDTNNEANNHKEKLKRIAQQLSEGYNENKEEKERLIDENNMLRIFAALGLVIGEFIHEIKNYLPGFDAEITYLRKLLVNNPIALERINLLNENLYAFNSYTSYFDKSISRNVQRDIEPINIKERISAFCMTIAHNIKKAHIDLTTNLTDHSTMLSDLTTIPMHPSEWASILFNLYTNAKKAIRRSESRNNGKINISCGESLNMVYIEFSDNGTGVDPLIQDRIFDAFVTTTSISSNNSDDIETYTGTGLGLKIIKDIVSSYNGTVYLKSQEKEGYKTTFRIEIPKQQIL